MYYYTFSRIVCIKYHTFSRIRYADCYTFSRIKRIILLWHGKTVPIRLLNTPDFIIFLCDGIARIENQ